MSDSTEKQRLSRIARGFIEDVLESYGIGEPDYYVAADSSDVAELVALIEREKQAAIKAFAQELANSQDW